MTSDWDDSGQLDWLEEQRCALVRGEARDRAARRRRGRTAQELEYDRLVVATGRRAR